MSDELHTEVRQLPQASVIDLSGDVQISFTTTTFQSGNDKRDLGFLADFAVQGLDDLEHGDLVGGPGQRVAALHPPVAGQQAAAPRRQYRAIAIGYRPAE